MRRNLNFRTDLAEVFLGDCPFSKELAAFTKGKQSLHSHSSNKTDSSRTFAVILEFYEYRLKTFNSKLFIASMLQGAYHTFRRLSIVEYNWTRVYLMYYTQSVKRTYVTIQLLVRAFCVWVYTVCVLYQWLSTAG